MSDEKRSCSKCGGDMDVGFLIDLYQKNPAIEFAEQMEWVEGDSEQRSALTGGVTLAGKNRRKVSTYCCTDCGYLESYAAQ
jgi:hypothetical protein